MFKIIFKDTGDENRSPEHSLTLNLSENIIICKQREISKDTLIDDNAIDFDDFDDFDENDEIDF